MEEVAPEELFYCGDETWATYRTNEGHLYYLTGDHSQWYDPRIYGKTIFITKKIHFHFL